MDTFLNYCKNPIYIKKNNPLNYSTFLKFYFFYLFLAVFISVPSSLLCKLLDITHKLTSLSWELAVYGILIAPVLEEVLFRLLLKPNKTKLNIYLVVIIMWILTLLAFERYIYASIIFIVFIIAVSIVLLKKMSIIDFSSDFKWIFYISAIIFSFVHISNFNGITISHTFILPILVLPQLLLGIILGYFRMMYGFKHAVIYHISVNLLLLFTVS